MKRIHLYDAKVVQAKPKQDISPSPNLSVWIYISLR